MDALKATAVKYVDYGVEGMVFTSGMNPDGEMEIFAEGNDVDKLNALNSGTIIYKANYSSFSGDSMIAVLGAKTAGNYVYVGTSENGTKYRVNVNNGLNANAGVAPVLNKDVAFAVTYDNAASILPSIRMKAGARWQVLCMRQNAWLRMKM